MKGNPRQRATGRTLRALLATAVIAPIAILATSLPASASETEATTTTLVSAPYSEPYAGTFEITAQVAATGSPYNVGSLAAGDGSVTFSDPDHYFSCSNVAIDSSGDASCESSALGVPGSDTITAAYSGYTLANTNSFQSSSTTGGLTVTKASTTLSLSTGSPAVGETATITATISPNPAGGTVSFSDTDNATSSCSAVSVIGGSATCTTSTLTTAGTDTVSATFNGDSYANTSSNSAPMTIAKGSDTLAVSTAGSVGGTATVTATVSPNPGGGTVTFSDPDGYLSCSPVLVVGGSASCTTGTLSAPGSETVSATYNGDSNYSSNGPATATLSVAQDTTSIVVSSNPSSPTLGQTFTVTATLSPDPGGGSVTFSDSKSYLSGCGIVDVVDGTASCTSRTVTATGSDSVSATYSGDTDYAGSGPTSATLTLSPATPSISVGSSPSSPTVGEQATITASVSPAGGAPTPTGTVIFSDSKGFISGCTDQPITAGSASCTTSTLTSAESDSITITYSGDANYYAVGPNSYGNFLHISAANTSVALSSSPSAPVALSTATITATVSPITDGGTVSFSDSKGYITGCSSVSVTAGVASCLIGTLGAGTDQISASYVGDANYNDSSANPLSLVIAKVATTVTPAVTPNPVTDGQTARVTATVSPTPMAAR